VKNINKLDCIISNLTRSIIKKKKKNNTLHYYIYSISNFGTYYNSIQPNIFPIINIIVNLKPYSTQ